MASSSAALAGTIRFGGFEGLNANRFGLGTNRVTDTEEAYALLRRAVELDINFIDTAHIYQAGASETTIGKTFRPYPSGLIIATKGGMQGASPEKLGEEVEESLRRLNRDSLDLYQLHRVDPQIPIEESVGALKKLQEAGKIRYVGLSGVSVEQIKAARSVMPIVSVQNEYNLVNRDSDPVVDFCTETNTVFIPWHPLGGRGDDSEKITARVAEIAKKYQASPQQIALAWLLRRSPMLLPIPGTLSIEHLEANVEATNLQLSDEDFAALNQV